VRVLSTTEDVQKRIMEMIDNVSKRYEMFSNPLRILILSIILAKEEINWTALKENIEKLTETTINPNTLAFHLGKLVETGYLLKAGTTEQPVYKIDPKQSSSINLYIENSLIEEIKEGVSI
jgi:DNA-binding transcriptional ArsR family regulator